jgi:hypothetical protein
MLEQDRPRRGEDFGGGPQGLGTIFAGDDAGVGMVTVSHGLHQEQLPVANMTVGQIRTRLADRLDIDPQGRAQLDGRDAGDDEVVRPGQMLMFVHRAGEKG